MNSTIKTKESDDLSKYFIRHYPKETEKPIPKVPTEEDIERIRRHKNKISLQDYREIATSIDSDGKDTGMIMMNNRFGSIPNWVNGNQDLLEKYTLQCMKENGYNKDLTQEEMMIMLHENDGDY